MTDPIATTVELVEPSSFNRAQLIAGSFLADRNPTYIISAFVAP